MRRYVLTAATVALLLAGCSAADPASPTQTSSTPAGEQVVTNCGTTVTFDTAPERVVTIKSTSTEMLLALGLADRIVGTGFQDGPVPEQWATAAANIPVLSDKVPGQEAVLDAEPDLIYAGWESNFSPDGAGNRADLAALGVATYVSPAACKNDDRLAALSFSDIYSEIGEVASIFDADATSLIAEQKAEVSGISPDTRGLTALWYSSGSDTPYVGAGLGAPQLIMNTIGLTNIAADVADTWSPFSWESVIDANPDVIVLVDSSWGTVAKKIGVLESNPATARLDAVVNGRYLIVPFAASEAGVRTASAAADLARQLSRLDVK
ncbi:MAG: putative F420-0 ABC transporter substrate-binding protein [Microbacteriaceae bacterium]